MCSFDCSSYMQVPITTNNDAHSRYVSPFLEKNYAGFGTRSTGWTQSSQIGQVLYHGRDGHATKPSWHGRLAREGLGVMRLTRYLSQPAPFALCPLAPRSMVFNRIGQRDFLS